MNAELREDIEALTDTVRRFTLERIAPQVAQWDEAGEIPRELYREAAAIGLLGLGYPEALGGTPAPFALRNAVSVTMARHGGSGGVMAALFSLNIGLPPVLRHGSAQVQQEVIPPVLRGEKIAALAITEPGGGSDVAALRTTARREGGRLGDRRREGLHHFRHARRLDHDGGAHRRARHAKARAASR